MLDIGLVHQVDSVPVAELVPAFVIGVVTGTHRVEVVRLKEHNVPHHPFS